MGLSVTSEHEACICATPSAGVIVSDLALMPALDLVTWLGNRSLTGSLELRGGRVTRRVSVESGVAVRIRSSSSADGLAQFLLNAGAVCAATLDQAVVECQRTARRLGYVLVTRHGVSGDEVRRVLEHQIREIVLDAARWPAGRMVFVAHGAEPPQPEVPARVSLLRLRQIAAARAQHWTAFEETFADRQARWQVHDSALPRRADPIRDHIVSLIRDGDTVLDLIRDLPLTAYEIYARLHELARLGAIRVPGARERAPSISPLELVLDEGGAEGRPLRRHPSSADAARAGHAAAPVAPDLAGCGWTPRAASTLEATLSGCQGPTERLMVRSLDGRKSIAELQAATSLSREAVIAVLVELAERGLVHL